MFGVRYPWGAVPGNVRGGTPTGSRAPVHTFEHFPGTNAALQRRVFGLVNKGEQQ